MPKVAIRTPGGSTEISLPPPGDFESFYVFAMHKSGSTLVNALLKGVLEAKGIAKISIPDLTFEAGLLPNDIQNPQELYFERGYGYLGYRSFPDYLRPFDLSNKKKVLLIRDPRDMVVSFYFSVAKSHRVPDAGLMRDQLLSQRKEASESHIDEFCLAHIADFIDEFNSYEHLLNTDIRIYRYEDVIFNKAAWLQDMLSYFGIGATPELIAGVARENDIVPSEERPNDHIRQVHPGNFRKHLKQETIAKLGPALKPILEKYRYSLG